MRVYVAGINGLVGSAFALQASRLGHDVIGKSSSDLDFTERGLVFSEMKKVKPDCLFISAAKVGGIKANFSMPVDFLSTNLQIQTNLLDAAHAADIERVLFLGSSCIYPKFSPQPMPETALLTGELEPTNESYALAKIAGIKLIQAYRTQYGHHWISAMPTNLYGPRDNFDTKTAHVLPALINRFHAASRSNQKEVIVWGDGKALREFLHVDDLARACLLLIDGFNELTPINIGSGQEISIFDLAHLISRIVGYKGEIVFDNTSPNGTPRKFLDSTLINKIGWEPQINLEEGIRSTYDWFLKKIEGR
jgi:GDP-L-fucose synthase